MSETTKKKGELDAQVEDLVKSAYVRMLVPSRKNEGYVAEVLELPGCLTEGDSPEEAYQNLEEAMRGYFKTLLAHKLPVPEPVGEKEYSGHFPLRMSCELHRTAALRAAQEGVSLNNWIGNAIASHLAGVSLMDQLDKRLQKMTAMSISVQAVFHRVAMGGLAVSTSPQVVRLGDSRIRVIESGPAAVPGFAMFACGKEAVRA